MATTTIKMGKRGTIVLPAKLRKQFGLNDGSLLVTEAKDGAIHIRPALMYEPPVWSAEEKAYYILINSMTKEEYDRTSSNPAARNGRRPRPMHRDSNRITGRRCPQMRSGRSDASVGGSNALVRGAVPEFQSPYVFTSTPTYFVLGLA